MKFRVAKDKILEGLQQVQNIIETRTTLPILQNVLIHASNHGLELSTTNLDLAITCKVEAQVSENGLTTLPARKLFGIFRELPASEIDVEVDNKDAASIRSGHSFFKILGLSKDEFPPFPKRENVKQINIEQALLKDMFRKTSYAISHDESRPTLNGTLMRFKDKKLTVVSTDGRRLALTDSELEFAANQEADLILPSRTVGELQRMLSDSGELTFTVSPNRVWFDMNGATLSSSLVVGSFPKFEQVIPAETKERVTLERELLLNALRRVSIVTSEKSHKVKLVFGKDTLEITANTPDLGEARENIPIKYRGKDFAIAFNPDYLMDPLKTLSSDEIHFDFTDERSPGVIRINTSTFLYVIMPMLVD